jgi:predicted nuclease of predicted toxin-antitoxin system
VTVPLGLYMDVHIPAAVTAGLRRRGVDVTTSQEDGTRESDDESLLPRAIELGRLLVTQDNDFLPIAPSGKPPDAISPESSMRIRGGQASAG